MKKAFVDKNLCVACGCCIRACKKDAITVPGGVCAVIDMAKCVGCGLCVDTCPASIITVKEVTRRESEKMV